MYKNIPQPIWYGKKLNFLKNRAQHEEDMSMMPEKIEEKNAVQTKEPLGCFKNLFE